MKKFFLCVSLTAMLFAMSAFFTACDKTDNSSISIALNKKYVYISDTEERYFVFETQSTGYYYYYYENGDNVTAYKNNFKYTETSDGALHLYYLSVDYLEDHTGAITEQIAGYSCFYYSKDLIYRRNTGGTNTMYYNEDYIDDEVKPAVTG